MADSDHSSHDATTSVDCRGSRFISETWVSNVIGDNNSQDPKLLDFSEDEETLIARMYTLVGRRWSLIAGRIPGRTAEEIEKYWTSRCSNGE